MLGNRFIIVLNIVIYDIIAQVMRVMSIPFLPLLILLLLWLLNRLQFFFIITLLLYTHQTLLPQLRLVLLLHLYIIQLLLLLQLLLLRNFLRLWIISACIENILSIYFVSKDLALLMLKFLVIWGCTRTRHMSIRISIYICISINVIYIIIGAGVIVVGCVVEVWLLVEGVILLGIVGCSSVAAARHVIALLGFLLLDLFLLLFIILVYAIHWDLVLFSFYFVIYYL